MGCLRIPCWTFSWHRCNIASEGPQVIHGGSSGSANAHHLNGKMASRCRTRK